MNFAETRPIRITCAPELSEYVRAEIEEMGFPILGVERTSVDTTGTLSDTMRMNLRLRTAHHVLYLLKEGHCSSPEDLYDVTGSIPWENIIAPDGYLSIQSRVDNPTINNWMFASLKAKDAIVDRIMEKTGMRPDSGPDRRGVVVNLYWKNDDCWMYLNTSGQKLADRGYRRIPHKAPMQESLAAGVLMATGYTGEQPLINPMCGSGTLAIETALMATGRAPGLLRGNFGLMHVIGFDNDAWQATRRDVTKLRRKNQPAPIIATDHDPGAIKAAQQNAKTAGVDHLIQFGVCDFAETPIAAPPGIVLLNPEYGERLGDVPELEKTYERIGDFFKQKCKGHTGYIFTGNRDLAKRVGLRVGRKIVFWNAKIECRLFKYELYEGTREKYGQKGT
jgi:putative N6-adenine-specific DNA methylase